MSFVGIDCDAKATVVMQCIDRHLAIEGRRNRYWDYFLEKRAAATGPKYDDLYLIHSGIQMVRELFETWDDTESLALLDKLEEECC